MSRLLLQLVTFVVFITIQGTAGYMRVCYYTNWAQYRTGAKFTPEDIPPHLCTHIFYAFATLTNNNIISREWNDDTIWSPGMYERVNSLKKSNADLKVLVSVGGWISGDVYIRTSEFRYTANSAANRTTFIKNAIKYIRDRNLDGLDIDWEYPQPADQHLQLMKELREAFDTEGQNTNREPLSLAAAVWGNAEESADKYKMGELGSYMDIIAVMSYDYYGSWDNSVKQHSILYPEIDDVISLWLSAGFPANKLVIGISTYGRSFTLANSAFTQPAALASGGGSPGPITKERGFLSYIEICTNIKTNGWTEIWDSDNLVPYAFYDNQWVGYDNQRSVELKMKYVIEKGLGGAMVWTLDFDDFLNRCGDGKYPLIKIIEKYLPNISGPKSINTTATRTTSTTTTIATTTKAAVTAKTVDCSDPSTPAGIYVYPNKCEAYINCFYKMKFTGSCPPGLLFDPRTTTCNWDYLVKAYRTDC